MHSFLVGFAAGIGIILSLAGWGTLVVTVLRIRSSTGFGFNAAVGLALTTSVGGILNLAHSISPGVVRAYVIVGLLIAAIAGAAHARQLYAALSSAGAFFRQRKLLAVVALVFALVTFVKYGTAVSPGIFHPQDDYHAYMVFPVKMLQTGSLGQDPFSERRIVTSLGGKYFLDTLTLSVTGQFKNFRLMDEAVSFIILLALSTEIMIRNKIPGRWVLATLLATSLLPAALSNVTSVYGGIALLMLLFELLDNATVSPGLNQAALLAIVIAGLMSLKTTFAPMGGILFLSFFWLQLSRSTLKGKTAARAVFCGLLIFALLLPWMIASYRSSGTFFYPLLGKGYHGSVYGIYLLPTAHMGFHNLLAFFDGLTNLLGGVLAIEVYLVILAFQKNRNDRLIEVIIVINFLVDIVFIGIGLGGVQVYRYAFALLFAVSLFLLIKQLAFDFKPSASNQPLVFSNVGTFFLVGVLLGGALDQFTFDLKYGFLPELRFALSGRDIVNPSEVSDYNAMQLTIPPGQKVLVRLDKNFLLDFRRNTIYVDDLPGGASLPPGIPIFQGPEPLANYLLQHGIRYVAYSYGDEASFSRALYGDRLAPTVNVWLRMGAETAFDFQDNVVRLGNIRKKLYDDGKMFVLDLAAPTQPASASSPTAAVDNPAVTPHNCRFSGLGSIPSAVDCRPGMSTTPGSL